MNLNRGFHKLTLNFYEKGTQEAYNQIQRHLNQQLVIILGVLDIGITLGITLLKYPGYQFTLAQTILMPILMLFLCKFRNHQKAQFYIINLIIISNSALAFFMIEQNLIYQVENRDSVSYLREM